MRWLFKELTAINKQLEKSQTELSVPKPASMRELMQNKLPLSEFEIKDAASALDFVRQFRNSMVPAQYRLKFSFATSTQGKKGSVVSLTIAMFHSAVDIHVEPLKGAETVTSKGSYVRLLDGLQDLYRTWEDYFVGQNRYQVEAGASRDLLKLLKSKQLEFIEAWLPENVELFVRVLAVLIVAEPIRCNVNLPLGVMALHLIKHQVKTSDNLFKDDGFWPAAPQRIQE